MPGSNPTMAHPIPVAQAAASPAPRRALPAAGLAGQYALAAVNAVSEIVFLKGPLLGTLVLCALALRPGALALGLAGLLAGYAIAQLMQLGRDYLAFGHYSFNPLLAGLSVGYLFQPAPEAFGLAACAGALAFVLSWALAHALRTLFLLPVLSVPFVLVSWMVHLASWHYSGLALSGIGHEPFTGLVPPWVEAFLRTMGLVFFMPNIWVGSVVALAVLLHSRILFVLAVAGFAFGTVVRASLTGAAAWGYTDPAAFNFVLVAMALGGFFLVPSPRSFLLAMAGTAMVAVLGEAVAVFWKAVYLPVHALPYNVVTLLVLYVLGIAASPLLARKLRRTPEDTLRDSVLDARRADPLPAAATPFTGCWTVWQGNDGAWTHTGPWRHAIDFVITGEDGRTHTGDGTRLEDYLAWGKPVLAPVRGTVLRVVANLPDGEPGAADQINSWGNSVVVRDERGIHWELSHFQQDSIQVREGQLVELGMLLGRCGNSGNSSQPHLHMQAQYLPDVGAPSIPFRLRSFRADDRWQMRGMPSEGQRVANAATDVSALEAFSFPTGSTLVLRDRASGEARELRASVTESGEFCLEAGAARLGYRVEQDRFVATSLTGQDRWLEALYLVAPSVPLHARAGVEWEDSVPVAALAPWQLRPLLDLAGWFRPGLMLARYHGRWESPRLLRARIHLPWREQPLQAELHFGGGMLLEIRIGRLALAREERTTEQYKGTEQ